jgi:hypothetical protein
MGITKKCGPSEFLRIGNKFVNLQQYKDCFLLKKLKYNFLKNYSHKTFGQDYVFKK